MITAHAVLASGRTLDTTGTDDDIDNWLDELRSMETVLDLDVHELTEAEVNTMPIMDSPGTSAEEDDA